MTSGNSRSKVSTRKQSQLTGQTQGSSKSSAPGANNQVYMPSQSQMYTGMHGATEANNLVNFYNSNLLDEMLSKN